jgi:hypothetical protein
MLSPCSVHICNQNALKSFVVALRSLANPIADWVNLASLARGGCRRRPEYIWRLFVSDDMQVIPPYNSQKDKAAEQYFTLQGVDKTLKFYKEVSAMYTSLVLNS